MEDHKSSRDLANQNQSPTTHFIPYITKFPPLSHESHQPTAINRSNHGQIHTSSISNLAVLTLAQVFLSRDTGLMFIPAERHKNRHRSARRNISLPVRASMSSHEQWH